MAVCPAGLLPRSGRRSGVGRWMGWNCGLPGSLRSTETRVATRIAERKPVGYDAAVELLVDLSEVADLVEFARRLDQLRQEHGRKPAFIAGLAHAGL